MRWTSLGLTMVLGTGACLERRAAEPTHTDPAHAELAPADPLRSREAAPAGSSEPAPDPPPGERASPLIEPELPTVARAHDRTVIASPITIEALVPIPEGIAFAQGGEIWALAADEGTLRKLATTVDPHGLVTDGRWLYWLGHERNGKLELATGQVEPLASFGAPGEQVDLAIGDVLYGRSGSNAVWRFEGNGIHRIDVRPDRTWRALPGLGAAERVVYLPMIDTAARPLTFFILRLHVGGRSTRIPVEGAPQPLRWSVSRTGSLVLIGEQGTAVMRLDGKATKPRKAFDEPGVSAVCWCGDDVCTVDEDDGVVRRHRRGSADAEVLARDVGPVARLGCDERRVAWSTADDGEHAHEIHVVALP
jgi:hypothetical protein